MRYDFERGGGRQEGLVHVGFIALGARLLGARHLEGGDVARRRRLWVKEVAGGRLDVVELLARVAVHDEADVSDGCPKMDVRWVGLRRARI